MCLEKLPGPHWPAAKDVQQHTHSPLAKPTYHERLRARSPTNDSLTLHLAIVAVPLQVAHVAHPEGTLHSPCRVYKHSRGNGIRHVLNSLSMSHTHTSSMKLNALETGPLCNPLCRLFERDMSLGFAFPRARKAVRFEVKEAMWTCVDADLMARRARALWRELICSCGETHACPMGGTWIVGGRELWIEM